MAGMAGCAAAVVGQAEFLGQTLCNNHHRPTTTTTAAGGALQVVSLFGKKKPAASAKKAVQKAVAKVNKPTNEELAKWYGMSDLFSSAPSFTHFIHSLSLSQMLLSWYFCFWVWNWVHMSKHPFLLQLLELDLYVRKCNTHSLNLLEHQQKSLTAAFCIAQSSKKKGMENEMAELACREMVEWVGAMMFSLLLFLSAGFLQALTAESIFPKVCLTNLTFLHT